MKTRILWNNECSVLKTGYATYGREILKRLHATGKYELAELGCYVEEGDPRLRGVPWRVYPNLPDKNNQNEVQSYNSDSTNQFGAWRFEATCLDFKPHCVMTITDFWMQTFVESSPFRPYYNWVTMPTCDALHQNKQWLDMYSRADGVFSYQDWSKEILKQESGGKIQVIDSASPAADVEFVAYNSDSRNEVKKAFGLENYTIIGTVMRNQRRKLFPDLFHSFREILNRTGRTDVLLYCHTSYPDMGWNLPELILEYGLSSKVLMTYVCRECGSSFPSFFNDALMTCYHCGKISAGVSSVQAGVDNKVLASIYNLFDVYTQISNSEGFGITMVESAACGTPIVGVDYSAMTDVIRKLGGVPIKPLSTYMELETGCYRAVPDNEKFIDIMIKLLNSDSVGMEGWRKSTRKMYDSHYGWDKTAAKWEKYIDSIDANYYEHMWHRQPQLRQPSQPQQVPENISNKDFVRWLVLDVLCDEKYVDSYMESKLLHDLNYGVAVQGAPGMYYNDMSQFSVRPQWTNFSRQDAYNYMRFLCEKRNRWEEIRWNRINQ